jgi:uncharacterized protein (DUF488 family)
MTSSEHSIFTIGHSTHGVDRFLDLLTQHGIQVVVDVRSAPYSRYNPQYNQIALEASLKNQGIRYLFLGKELGARSEDPSCYVGGRVQYSRIAQTECFRSGIERVKKGSQSYRIALMCSEKEPLECHRTLLVSRVLSEEGMSVLHIHADGQLEEHGTAMDRLLELTSIPGQDLFRTRRELLEEALAKQESVVAYVDENLATGSVREEVP